MTELRDDIQRFTVFLDLLATNQLIEDFTMRLMNIPSEENNCYLDIGDRWCGVEDLIKGEQALNVMLNDFAFKGRDSEFAFSSGNLKAQYIPNEDFVGNGSAFVLFSLVGTKWSHIAWVEDELDSWEKCSLSNKTS